MDITRREKEILILLGQGLTNREIGEKLYLSPLTIRNYLSWLLIKYEARNRTHLIAKFMTIHRQQYKRILL